MLDSIAGAVPRTIGSWRAEDPDRRHDPESIFNYIDGHAEVFLAYSMRGCVARRYSGEDVDIVLDVFEMETPADAFGVFTHDLEGEAVSIGEDSRYRWGWLSFWQGRVFVSITAEDDTETVRKAVLELGRLVAEAAPGESAMPPIVKELPAEGLDRASIRYLYHPQILAWHEPSASRDPLGMGDADVPVALAEYRRDGATARVLVAEFGTAVRAAAGLDGVQRAFGVTTDVRRIEGSGQWAAAKVSGRRLAVVYDARDADTVHRLLSELTDTAAEREEP